MARDNSVAGTSIGTSACWADIWKGRDRPHRQREAEQQLAAHSLVDRHRGQQDRRTGLQTQTYGHKARPVNPISGVTRGEGRQHRRRELKQADQAQIPGAAGQLVHVPADGQQKHLLGGRYHHHP